jgi:hypothetical protein
VVEPIRPGLNPRFGVSVVYLCLIILLVVGGVTVTARRSLTDFVNLKIKPTQSFECAHRGRVRVCIFIGVSAHK